MEQIKRKILKLYSAADNTVLSVNSEYIVYVNIDDDRNQTTVYTYADEADRYVNGSPDKIYNILKDYGFVRCHRQSDNTVELFNIEYFIACGKDGDDTIIYLNNGIEMCVNETPETIYNTIEAAELAMRGQNKRVVIEEVKPKQDKK